jgi:putative flippase GtrA
VVSADIRRFGEEPWPCSHFPVVRSERPPVTCPPVLGSSAESVGEPPRAPEPPRAGVGKRLLTRFRRDDALAQLTRFALVGASSTLLYALFFLTLHPLGYLPAHIMATVLSSVFANELHRRLTFHADERVTWLTAQWQAGAVSLVGLLATSAALGRLHATARSAPPALQIALVIAVTMLIGTIRFIALRWIFRPEPGSRVIRGNGRSRRSAH